MFLRPRSRSIGQDRRRALRPLLEGLEGRALLSTATTTGAAGGSTIYSTAPTQVHLFTNVQSSLGGVCGGGTLTFTVRNGTTVVGSPASCPITYSVQSGVLGQRLTINESVDYSLPAGTPPGNYSVEADYSGGLGAYYVAKGSVLPGPVTYMFGSATFSASSNTSGVVTVLGKPTTTTVTPSVAAPAYGQAEMFTASVVSSDGTIPAGSVQFLADGVALGPPATLAGGATSLTTSSLIKGNHAIAAEYLGSTFLQGSTGTTTVAVSGVPTTTSVTASLAATVFGQPDTLKATVVDADPAGPTPSGSVQFLADGSPVGSPVPLAADGTASLTTTALPAGTDTVEADFVDDIEYGSSRATASDPVSVATTGTTTAMTPSTTALVYGQYLPILVAVTPAAPSTAPVSGSVQFSIDGVVCTPAMPLEADGRFHATITNLELGHWLDPGRHTIAVQFGGDGYLASQATSDVIVSPAATSTSVSPTSPSVIYGQEATLTATVATVSPGSTTPAGSVQFLVDGADAGSPVVLDGNGQATLTTPILHAGSHSVAAIFLPSSAIDLGSDDLATPSLLPIGPAPLTVIVAGASKSYGAGLPALTCSYAGFVNGDTAANLSAQPTLQTTATAASHAGSYPITASGAADSDYAIRYVAGTLSVTPVPLTIAANGASMIYGAASPTLSATYSGFVNGDTPASLTVQPTLQTTATRSSHVGSYPVNGSAAADPDYAIRYTPGTLTITPTPLTIAANGASKVYGAASPTLSATYSGFVNGDTALSLGKLPTLATTATSSSHVGSYPITVTGTSDPDYSITFRPGTLAVTPAALTVAANAATKVYGAAVPALSATYAGFVNGDTPAGLSGKLQLLATATMASPVGSYYVYVGGLGSTDYTITNKAATLAVTPASLTITANSLASTVGLPLPTLTASYAGFVNGDTLAGLTGKLQLVTTATAGSPAGIYWIYVGGVGSPNYTITFKVGTLTLKPKS